ncbi:MAG: hypothetical protein B7Z08_08635 [Sphingomonadales bacterium 32-68-7]|nr:MAG: hypothetical protein B7Z33_04295 [Sphingomonadales bacterium 12-68-11]OYX08638.1 MAG: hypothetical protein B7Z08_08635 [Sphingomonadales bacterium 32-68-7]
MDTRPPPPLAESLAAALDWWREAGVDLAFHDEPQTWLKADEPDAEAAGSHAPPATEALPLPRLGGDPAAWPRDFEAFRHWWLAEPSLDTGGLGSRLAPRGPAGAPLMIAVPMPEAEDSETLLSGPHGRLLANMAHAMGFAPDAVLVAAALPRHASVPDWAALTAGGLGAVLQHLIALAAPQRLIVLGRDILPLLAHDPAQDAPAAREITIHGRAVPALSGYAPGRLLEHPRLRADLWRSWLDWTESGTR